MIAADQPTCFPPEVLVALSSKSDGTMLDRAVGVYDGSVQSNRTAFCRLAGVDYGNVVFQRIVYDDTQTYDRIVEVGHTDTARYVSEVRGDALFTSTSGVGLLLPVADCVATVVYDPVRQSLALLHLGRHSSLTTLITKTIDLFTRHGSDPADLLVWMSPNIHQSHYRMDYFDQADTPEWQPFVNRRKDGLYIDLQGHNRRQFVKAGVRDLHIYDSPHNTAEHNGYFSHSQGDTTGRFAVLAMVKP